RAAAHPGQEARAGDERARLAPTTRVARLVDAFAGDAGPAARPAAVRYARLPRHLPRRRRLQPAVGRRVSRRGRFSARALVGARRRAARLERRRQPARAHQCGVDPCVRLCRGAPAARRFVTWRSRRGAAGAVRARYGALGRRVRSRRAGARRDRVLRQRHDLYFAFRLPQPPADWFSLGLLRGFALPDRPLLLLTPEAKTRDLLALLRARGLNGVHAVELAPALLRARDWAGLRRVVFEDNDGFWFPGEER